MKPGPKKGYKQSAKHIAKRVKWGADHHAWKGADVTPKAGRSRAERLYRDVGPCVGCGKRKAERHHRDGDTTNNAPGNIVALCRRCHMRADGRLERFRTLARTNHPKAVAAAARARAILRAQRDRNNSR